MTRPEKGNTCAVFVTFHPDANLLDRVNRVAKQVDQTVIVDNGSAESCLEEIRKLANNLNTHLILNSRNEGIARGLNTGARWAASRGYRWVLTLDQDTVVAPDMIDSLAEAFGCYPSPERVAIVGSNYRDKVNGRVLCDGANGNGGSPGREMMTVLTSGSLISLSAFQAIGGFRDEFFIDCVDHEYCLRARANGFRVMMTSKPIMEHGMGHLTEHRLLWKKVGTSNYSAVRQYFMTRNALILAREYIRQEPRWVLRYLWAWVKSIIVICLFEEQRILKIKSIIRGCFDGALRRTNWNPS